MTDELLNDLEQFLNLVEIFHGVTTAHYDRFGKPAGELKARIQELQEVE